MRNIGKNGEKIMWDLESRVNSAVFPTLQGGPHNHQVAGIATAMKQAKTPEFKSYQEQVCIIFSSIPLVSCKKTMLRWMQLDNFNEIEHNFSIKEACHVTII